MQTTVVSPPDLPRPDDVVLTLPAVDSYARVARLAITGMASRLGFSYDEIEDVRIALGEVFTLLLDDVPGTLAFRCGLDGPDLRVEVLRTPDEGPPVLSELSEQILRAVVDEVEIDPDQARILIIKRSTR